MSAKPATVAAYLAALPEDRRAAIDTVRQVILKNLDSGFAEGIGYGMIAYHVPHSRYPAGYHCDPKQPLGFAMLSSQKSHMSLHLMCLYNCGDPNEPGSKLMEWFRSDWAKSGKKLDIGKACLRFKKIDDLALDTIAKLFRKVTVDQWIATTEQMVASRNRKPATKRTAKK